MLHQSRLFAASAAEERMCCQAGCSTSAPASIAKPMFKSPRQSQWAVRSPRLASDLATLGSGQGGSAGPLRVYSPVKEEVRVRCRASFDVRAWIPIASDRTGPRWSDGAHLLSHASTYSGVRPPPLSRLVPAHA